MAPPELASFLEGLPEPRIIVDSDYRVVAANRAYRDSYSSGEEVVGRRCHEVSHGYDRPCDESGESCPLRAARAVGARASVCCTSTTRRAATSTSRWN